MENKIFKEELEKLGIKLTSLQEEQLEQYYINLIESNKKINLTSITEKNEVYLKHFYDSLTLIKAYDLNKKVTICDLGTGAGFPGIVLKIVFPNLKMTLVDSLEKRTKFLKEVVEKLKLKDIEIITDRIENFSKNNKEKYDVLVSRAVAKTNVLLELGAQSLKVNGYFLLMKSNVLEEIISANNAIKVLSLKLEETIEFNLPIENSKRTIIKIKKIGTTNSKYPRDFAKIKKNSL